VDPVRILEFVSNTLKPLLKFLDVCSRVSHGLVGYLCRFIDEL
jgi:hypothetical protein